MTRPVLAPAPGALLDRVYDGLPDHYRDADARIDFPLYRWLAGICRELGAVETLIDRVDFVPVEAGGTPGDTSDLVDPTTADAAWLPWLAQLVGVTLAPELSVTEQRDAILYASAGWRAGTKSAVAAAARTELTGSKYAWVYDHSVSSPGDGGPWDVLIVTRATETPDVPAVLEAVIRRGTKPAGVVLHHRAYGASWDTVVSTYPTWNAIESAGSWVQIEEAGL